MEESKTVRAMSGLINGYGLENNPNSTSIERGIDNPNNTVVERNGKLKKEISGNLNGMLPTPEIIITEDRSKITDVLNQLKDFLFLKEEIETVSQLNPHFFREKSKRTGDIATVNLLSKILIALRSIDRNTTRSALSISNESAKSQVVHEKDLAEKKGEITYSQILKERFKNFLLKTEAEVTTDFIKNASGEENKRISFFKRMLATSSRLINEKKTSLEKGYVYKSTEWSSKDSLALTRVIPGYLSKILEALTGKERELFDFRTASFKTSSKFEKDERDFLDRDLKLANEKLQAALKKTWSYRKRREAFLEFEKVKEEYFKKMGSADFQSALSAGRDTNYSTFKEQRIQSQKVFYQNYKEVDPESVELQRLNMKTGLENLIFGPDTGRGRLEDAITKIFGIKKKFALDEEKANLSKLFDLPNKGKFSLEEIVKTMKYGLNRETIKLDKDNYKEIVSNLTLNENASFESLMRERLGIDIDNLIFSKKEELEQKKVHGGLIIDGIKNKDGVSYLQLIYDLLLKRYKGVGSRNINKAKAANRALGGNIEEPIPNSVVARQETPEHTDYQPNLNKEEKTDSFSKYNKELTNDIFSKLTEKYKEFEAKSFYLLNRGTWFVDDAITKGGKVINSALKNSWSSIKEVISEEKKEKKNTISLLEQRRELIEKTISEAGNKNSSLLKQRKEMVENSTSNSNEKKRKTSFLKQIKEMVENSTSNEKKRSISFLKQRKKLEQEETIRRNEKNSSFLKQIKEMVENSTSNEKKRSISFLKQRKKLEQEETIRRNEIKDYKERKKFRTQLAESLTNFREKTEGLLGKINKSVVKTGRNGKALFKRLITGILSVGSTIATLGSNLLTNVAGGLKKAIPSLLLVLIPKILGKVASLGKKAFGGLGGLFASMKNSIVSGAGALFRTVGNVFSSLKTKALNIFDSLKTRTGEFLGKGKGATTTPRYKRTRTRAMNSATRLNSIKGTVVSKTGKVGLNNRGSTTTRRGRKFRRTMASDGFYSKVRKLGKGGVKNLIESVIKAIPKALPVAKFLATKVLFPIQFIASSAEGLYTASKAEEITGNENLSFIDKVKVGLYGASAGSFSSMEELMNPLSAHNIIMRKITGSELEPEQYKYILEHSKDSKVFKYLADSYGIKEDIISSEQTSAISALVSKLSNKISESSLVQNSTNIMNRDLASGLVYKTNTRWLKEDVIPKIKSIPAEERIEFVKKATLIQASYSDEPAVLLDKRKELEEELIARLKSKQEASDESVGLLSRMLLYLERLVNLTEEKSTEINLKIEDSAGNINTSRYNSNTINIIPNNNSPMQRDFLQPSSETMLYASS